MGETSLRIEKAAEKEESNTLRIENIPNSFTCATICQLFCAYGSVYSCRLINHQNVAYVAYTTTESAKYAIENINGMVFDGMAIKLSYAPKILCNGQVLLEADQDDQITGLPFNAQYEKVSGILFGIYIFFMSFLNQR